MKAHTRKLLQECSNDEQTDITSISPSDNLCQSSLMAVESLTYDSGASHDDSRTDVHSISELDHSVSPHGDWTSGERTVSSQGSAALRKRNILQDSGIDTSMSEVVESHAATASNSRDSGVSELDEHVISDREPDISGENNNNLSRTGKPASIVPLRTQKSSQVFTNTQADYEKERLIKDKEWEGRYKAAKQENLKLKQEKQKLEQTVIEMKRCVEEYERTLEQIMSERSRGGLNVSCSGEGTLETLIAERDQALEDLATVEKAFGDLHRRFEKSKQVIDSLRQNEDSLKKCIEENQGKLDRQNQKYSALKHHAEEKLKEANMEVDKVRRENLTEVSRLQAAVRKVELQVQSLNAQLQQKKQENTELTKICDELINKCGT